MSVSKLLSLFFPSLYLIIIFFGGESIKVSLSVFIAPSLLGLACIWFGDQLGGMTELLGTTRGPTAASPGGLVRFMGWIILILPLLVAFIMQKGYNIKIFQ